MMRLVILESPYATRNPEGLKENIRYARLCMADCLRRGEAPLASHLLYTQPLILDDNNPEEREQGMCAGFAWGLASDATVVYVDLGISKGMFRGINMAEAADRPIEYRNLKGWER